MANAHDQFLQLERNISLSSGKKEKLIASRKALETKILAYFRNNNSLPTPSFFIQGSYKMKTMVIDKDGTYDVDLGIHFPSKPTIEPFSLQRNVFRAVTEHTEIGAQHREKCIRVIYKGDYDIDLPVYYQTNKENRPFLATKNGWIQSDPKELCDWFETQRSSKDKDGQMLRLVKYFKYWANIRAHKMPSGIALTIWVANNYCPNSRDDIAFYETAISIYNSFIKNIFFRKIQCFNPVTKGENLIERLDEYQLQNFDEYLDKLTDACKIAINEKNITKSCNIWRNHFGDKFPSV